MAVLKFLKNTSTRDQKKLRESNTLFGKETMAVTSHQLGETGRVLLPDSIAIPVITRSAATSVIFRLKHRY